MALDKKITVFEVYNRAKTGPKVDERDWDNKIIPQTASRLKEKYGIKMDKRVIVPTDPELINNLFRAGLEMLVECGVYSNGVLVPSTAFLSDSGTGCMNTGSSGAVSFQTAWNNAQEFNQPTSHYLVSTNSGGYVSAFASGGGVSQVFPMPTYQSSGANSISGLIESGYSSGGATCGVSVGTYCREVPDVSANADPAWGYLIYYAKKWTGFGGTSTATPLWAAYMADTDSLSSCGNNPVGFKKLADFT
ncbi:MAG: monomethylamine:corrinoid methyltransferase, partial [Firmicutes bacterium]|nr:monomethylamine:corrinoid methyltransferase [Bacillota bacterium]